MLRYLATGIRRFGRYPMTRLVRINWEFYAVIEGCCAPLFEAGRKADLLESALWVFPPENLHGWTGDARDCHIVAFHFGSVPPPLEKLVRREGYLVRTLTATQRKRIAELAAELEPHYREPSDVSPLHCQRALLELSLLVLGDAPASRLATLPTIAHDKVEAALTAFVERLAEHPSIETIADAVHVSPSHLRRLFWQVRQESPRTAFKRIAMERAMELMSQSDLTLAQIAEACGFAGANEFSRAFKQAHKIPPAVWRAGLLPPYRDPVGKPKGRYLYPQDQHPIVRQIDRYAGRRGTVNPPRV